MKKTKKAIVLPETLKLIIAVLCMLLLIYLAFSLYNIFVVKSKLTQAKETLEQITAKINGLEEGKETDYLVVAPKGGWYCIRESKKLCICTDKDLLEGIEECCKMGASLEFKGEIIIDSACTLYEGVFLKESKTFQECISFRNVPLNINLTKSDNIARIKTDASSEGEDIFEKLLEFKGAGEKTFRDLCREFVNNPSSSDLRTQLESKVEEFFSGKKGGIIFQIVETANEEKVVFPPLNLDDGKEIIANLQDYTFYQNVMDKKLEIKNSEGKSYSIILKIGEWRLE